MIGDGVTPPSSVLGSPSPLNLQERELSFLFSTVEPEPFVA